MKKKICLIWIVILGLMLTGCTVSAPCPFEQFDDAHRTDIQTFSGNRQGITLETPVSNDIAVLGLTLSDYRTVPEIRERGEREIITIAVAEYRPTEQLHAYLLFYLWAACGTNLTSINISDMVLTTNVGNFDLVAVRESEYFNFVKSNTQHNIFVFRSLEKHSIREFARHYDVTNLTFNYSNRNYSFDRHQSVTFRDFDDDAVDFELNSVVVINDNYLTYVGITRRVSGSAMAGFWDFLSGITPGWNSRPMLHFFNFNTSVDIERILEIDVEFTLSEKSWRTLGGQWACFHASGTATNNPAPNINSSHVSRKLTPGTRTVDWGRLGHFDFEYFQTPGIQRFYDNEFGSMGVNRNLFNYEHSILIHTSETRSRQMNLGAGWTAWDRYQHYVTELIITRMKFYNEGNIYNAFVIMRDGSVDQGTGYNPDSDFSDWFRDMRDAFDDFMRDFLELLQRIFMIFLKVMLGLLILFIAIKLLPIKIPLKIKLIMLIKKGALFFIMLLPIIIMFVISIILGVVTLITSLIFWFIRRKRKLLQRNRD